MKNTRTDTLRVVKEILIEAAPERVGLSGPHRARGDHSVVGRARGLRHHGGGGGAPGGRPLPVQRVEQRPGHLRGLGHLQGGGAPAAAGLHGNPDWEPEGTESLVEFVLEPQGGGTLLHVTHTRFATAEIRDRYDEGWPAVLGSLRSHIEG